MGDGSMSEAPDKKRPDQRIGSFVIIDECKGDDGDGHTRAFRARYRPQAGDPPLALHDDEVVLVRVLRDAAMREPAVMNAFSREAELLSLVDHPCLVRGLTRGVTSGRVWLATEYVEGEHLSTILRVAAKEGLRLRPELALVATLDALAGLGAAQALTDARQRPMGLIHRGLTPSRVLVDHRGQSHVTTLGSVLLSLSEEAPADAVVGTPGYLSPEQARREPLTQGSDVYAAGLLLFELLCGVPAFSGSEEALLRAHAENRRAPWPNDVDLPLDLKALVDQATADTPEERPADAAAMYALVEGLLEEPEDARARLALVVRDLVRTNPERPPPFFVAPERPGRASVSP
jgi:serine/threonine protein kinase